jgi:hypothetical protein
MLFPSPCTNWSDYISDSLPDIFTSLLSSMCSNGPCWERAFDLRDENLSIIGSNVYFCISFVVRALDVESNMFISMLILNLVS